jgi:L-ascorbate metabolism protein UlaG (beta-lactamase superfamily)
MSSTATVIYCGHSTVIIHSESGKRIIIDPWLEGNPSCPNTLFVPGHIDAICLTHGHADHCGSALELADKYRATVFATFELAMLLVKDGLSNSQVQPMNKGGSVKLPNGNGISISLTNAYHSSSYDSKDGKSYYSGEACGIIITLESGRSIYHAGDTCLFKDMELIGARFKPYLALLPIGDRFTMGPEDAARATQLIDPDFVIPIHHSTFDLLTGTPEEFARKTKDARPSTIILEPGESWNL